MYLGSVKFFKHLIYTVFILIFVTPIIIAIIFAFKYYSLKNKITPAESEIIISSTSAELVTQTPSIDDLCEAFSENSYNATEIIDAFNNINIDLVDEIYKQHFSVDSSSLSYTNAYPELFTTSPKSFLYTDNTIYLTFDDGPSENTMNILGILDDYDIKATFFVCGGTSERSKQIMRKIVERGHTIGIHSSLHDYSKIYQSVDSFLDDFYNTYTQIYDATGVKPNIFRFAGGSINNYNHFIYQQIIAETTRRGFVYYDWNISGEDASSSATWTSIYENVLSGANKNSRGIVLLHDGSDKATTVYVVEDLIIALQKKGFGFDRLTNDIMPITFGYID